MGRQKPSAGDVIGGIYEAALEPDLWPAALKGIADYLNGRSAVGLAVDVRAREVGFAALHGIEPRALADYQRHYVRIDPWNDYLRAMAPGRPIVSQAAMADAAFARTAFCNEFLAPQDIFYAMGGFVRRRGAAAFLVGVQRPRAAGGFQPAELARMEALFPHLARAARIHRRLARAGGLAQGLTAALERLPSAALLATRDGRIAWMNRAAEALLRRGDALCLREGRLEQGRLAAVAGNGAGQALQRLVSGSRSGSADAGGSCALPRENGRRPLTAQVTPLPGPESAVDLALDLPRPAALILIGDPDGAPPPPAERLARDFGLTAAEARIAAALAAGSSIAAYAETARLSIHTARWTLKQAMAKTGAHRQTDLVRQVIAAGAMEARQIGR